MSGMLLFNSNRGDAKWNTQAKQDFLSYAVGEFVKLFTEYIGAWDKKPAIIDDHNTLLEGKASEGTSSTTNEWLGGLVYNQGLKEQKVSATKKLIANIQKKLDSSQLITDTPDANKLIDELASLVEGYKKELHDCRRDANNTLPGKADGLALTFIAFLRQLKLEAAWLAVVLKKQSAEHKALELENEYLHLNNDFILFLAKFIISIMMDQILSEEKLLKQYACKLPSDTVRDSILVRMKDIIILLELTENVQKYNLRSKMLSLLNAIEGLFRCVEKNEGLISSALSAIIASANNVVNKVYCYFRSNDNAPQQESNILLEFLEELKLFETKANELYVSALSLKSAAGNEPLKMTKS